MKKLAWLLGLVPFLLSAEARWAPHGKEGERKIVAIEAVSDLIGEVDGACMVVLDLDLPLMRPQTSLGQPQWESELAGAVRQIYGMEKAEAQQEAATWMAAVWRKAEMEWLDPELVEAIKQMQNQRAVVMAITSQGEEMGFVYSDLLRRQGIELHDNDRFHRLDDDLGCVVEGIICAKGDKGEALSGFLQMVQHLPKRLIFVGHGLQEASLVSKGIDVWIVDFDQEMPHRLAYRSSVARIQLLHFDTILPDEVAELMIQRGEGKE